MKVLFINKRNNMIYLYTGPKSSPPPKATLKLLSIQHNKDSNDIMKNVITLQNSAVYHINVKVFFLNNILLVNNCSVHSSVVATDARD